MGLRLSKNRFKKSQNKAFENTSIAETNARHASSQTVDLSHTYGHHECQMSQVAEVDLHTHLNECRKNPGHVNFIPIGKFAMEHLPEGHHDIDLYELIKATADLTVRVGVNMVSYRRPQFFPNTSVRYPFNDMGGNKLTRSGTGQISVYRYVEGCGYNASGSKYNGLGKQFDSAHKVCTCSKCRQSDTPSKEWWEIIVYTAAHVVFDATEGDHTSCRLFYDDASSPKVILDQLHVINVNVERDSCHMKHVTCDVTLGGKLYAMDKICSDLWNKVRDKYVIRYGERLTFIVSHPHGCHKQVSVGQWMDNAIVGELNESMYLSKLTYTTSTCPGSSGARVYCLGFRGYSHVHNGALDTGLNYSSVDYCTKSTMLLM
ncbi:uncharacterized protein LOC106071804 isoform X2 [Biomphalaria glabrata]|uniref:Uncharacterized protein LOC106071804 isoform X2 n=1 Tax=Biomphalaria glabrata TaxID=6526 RepID=A0A2C9KI80_BIOGL|nr:uncharacterized protein LOC106071804 isoform X2 [Biomphalaria glabrata]